MNRIIPVLLLNLFFVFPGKAQNFLHTSGKYIYDGTGNEVILRGIGTGNWLLQEGYMMKSAEVAGPMYQFRQKLIQTIGVERTDIFYETWLNNHFTRRDADSMKAWGFNSVRVAMHYKWLTLPIEEESVAGQDTWLEAGFVRLDSLLAWCRDNELYLILDLHGAPGGQGHESNISDYDSSKPSLWESPENRRKTVALWKRLAQRYANEPWIGGYDILNEPNWELPGGTLLKQLYVDITAAIRSVDSNHIIILEGNWFGNDYTGLTPPWDDNIIYSFHKYWTYNTQQSLSWIIDMRNTYNVPIWLGESGENSNSWFTDLIALCEQNKIGWSWWPVKKAGINNVLQVQESTAYNNLMNYWKNGTPVFTADQAFNAVMEWADLHRIENCTVQYDVIDAMIRQPFTDTTKPFKHHVAGQPIAASDYDLGRSSSAYYDKDSADYHLETNVFGTWNAGWAYRNDGVDIAPSQDTDPGSNGYYVGWTEDGEWLEYTINTEMEAAWNIKIRSASQAASPARIKFSINGTDVSPVHKLPFTEGWQRWSTTTINHVIVPAGRNTLRLTFEKGGSNLSFFSLSDPDTVSNIPFQALTAETTSSGDQVIVTLNKTVTHLFAGPEDFDLRVDGTSHSIQQVTVDPDNQVKLYLQLNSPIEGVVSDVKLSMERSLILHDTIPLEFFTDLPVALKMPLRKMIPGLIQAEDFDVNVGFQLENCQDTGGGQNLAFANDGDYVDYLIYVMEAGAYTIDFRVASLLSNGRVAVRLVHENDYTTIGNISFTSTGGWQTWSNQSVSIELPKGNQTLRLYSLSGEYNINWFNISKTNSLTEAAPSGEFKVYPNPTAGFINIQSQQNSEIRQVRLFDIRGSRILTREINGRSVLSGFYLPENLIPGLYFLEILTNETLTRIKILKY